MPHATPMLQYDDPLAAIAMLCDVFGLDEVESARIEDGGTVIHAQIATGPARIFVAAVWADGGFVSPDSDAASSLVWFETPDVEGARERAVSWGGVVSELQGGPTGQLFRWTDPQGQRWLVGQE